MQTYGLEYTENEVIPYYVRSGEGTSKQSGRSQEAIYNSTNERVRYMERQKLGLAAVWVVDYGYLRKQDVGGSRAAKCVNARIP
jgi:hypothetical protein